MTQVQVKGESKVIKGHVLDVAFSPLLAALKRYDEQLYLKWKPSKRGELGVWQLRRKPELKTVTRGYSLETPRGLARVPGDIFEFDSYTISFPKYHETRHDVVKEFPRLDNRILDWVAKQDLWKYGHKGKDFATESAYQEAKFEEKVDEESYAEMQYMLKDMRTQIRDFREYILAGGDPYRLMDYWGK